MQSELFKASMESLKDNGFQILFESSTRNKYFSTYMADTQGNTMILNTTVKDDGEIDLKQVMLPIHTLKRFCDEATKLYDDALTKRLCSR